MIRDEMEMVSRLGEVEPLPDDVLERAEVVLRAAMATAEVRAQKPPAPRGRLGLVRGDAQSVVQGQAHHGARRAVMSGIAAAAVVVAGVGGALLATGSGSHGHGSVQATPGATVPTVALTGGTIRLASATMHLPSGFQAVDASCAPTPEGIGPSIELDGSTFAAAASAAGGCIQAWLTEASGSAVPAGQATTVNGERAVLSTDQTTGFSTLYVTVPADLYVANAETVDGTLSTLNLVLTARGISPSQLQAIASSGIPSKALAPGAPCTTSCG